MSGGSCGKGTFLAHLARSQPGVGTQYAHVGYRELILLWKLWSLVFLLSHQLSLMDWMWPCLVDPVEKARLLHISQGLKLV